MNGNAGVRGVQRVELPYSPDLHPSRLQLIESQTPSEREGAARHRSEHLGSISVPKGDNCVDRFHARHQHLPGAEKISKVSSFVFAFFIQIKYCFVIVNRKEHRVLFFLYSIFLYITNL
jgi:hypothetical protein